MHKIKIFNDFDKFDVIEGEFIDYDQFFFMAVEALKSNNKIHIDVDYKIITMEQYIEIINLCNENKNFQPPEDVQTTKDLKEWIDALSILEHSKDFCCYNKKR